MNRRKSNQMLKRAVTFTAAAIFCSIILFIGVFTAFIRMENTLSDAGLSMPYIEKTSQGQARFSALKYTKEINTQPQLDEYDERYAVLFLFPDDSSVILSLLEKLYEEFSLTP